MSSSVRALLDRLARLLPAGALNREQLESLLGQHWLPLAGALGAIALALIVAIPLALGTRSEGFVLRTSDGARIVAELHGSGDDWVLLGHMFPTHRHTWDKLAERLVDEGYRVLVWDFRCHGDSPCVYSNSKNDDVPDIWQEWEAAIDYAVNAGASRIAGLGASMGGTSLMQVAAYRTEFRAVGAISSPNMFRNQVEDDYRGYDGNTWDRLDGLSTIDQITVPKLYLVGARNKCAYLYSERFWQRAVGDARLVVYETDLHGTTMIDHRDIITDAQAEIVRFLENPDGVDGKELRNEAPDAVAHDECYPPEDEAQQD